MKHQILISPEKCTGCMRCALACSYFTTKEHEFNVSKARITVLPGWQQRYFDIRLGEECDHCGICVQYCAFGTLAQVEGKTQAG